MKEVKIIGLSVNKQLGGLKACNVSFDPENRLIAVKGEVGAGKSTLQKSIKIGSQGSKSMVDKGLYGKIDQEIQLLDGSESVFISVKSDENNTLTYILYQKDKDGKKINNPIIDGVKASPSKYLDNLQTKLTWRIDELTSENPTVQKKIVLDLYGFELKKIGADSILKELDASKSNRYTKDVLRKQVGGIAEHLKEKGVIVDKVNTHPKFADISEITRKINNLEYKIESGKEGLSEKKEAALAILVNKGQEFNLKLKEIQLQISKSNSEIISNTEKITKAIAVLEDLKERGLVKELKVVYDVLTPLKELEFENGRCKSKIDVAFSQEINALLNNAKINRKNYSIEDTKPLEFDEAPFLAEIASLRESLIEAEANNKLATALDSFFEWRDADIEVIRLQDKYTKALKSINTGVEGLSIDFEGDKLYLKYDGSYDPKYFNNIEKETKKLSSYSHTQKPMIALLLQNYLLSLKVKAMRYLFIDDIPIDKKTQALLGKMCEELNLNIFVNITGDFEVESLKDGEILVQGGELFFNK